MAICWIPRTRNGRGEVLAFMLGMLPCARPTTDIHEFRHHGLMSSPDADTPGDLSWASFTNEAPWEVERDEVRWLNLAVTLRRQAQAEVPALTKPSLLPPGARVVSVGGRLTTAVAPWLVRKRLNRYGGDPAASRADISKRLRKAAEVLGPTYIKLGQ